MVNNSIFLDYAHRLPFDQVNAISISGCVHVSYISFQVRLHPALVPRGWVWGPVPLQVLLCEPKGASQSHLQVLLGSHLWLPQSVLLVSLSLSGTPAQAPGLEGFLSPSLSVIPLVRRPCASRKNLESN